MNFNYRRDYIFSIGKLPFQNTSNYQLTDYFTYDYFDVEYKITTKFSFSTGVGWIYQGKGLNVKLNTDYGYYSATFGLKYNIDWLTFEIRGDIPVSSYEQPAISNDFLFPVSLALYYHFRSQKNQ